MYIFSFDRRMCPQCDNSHCVGENTVEPNQKQTNKPQHVLLCIYIYERVLKYTHARTRTRTRTVARTHAINLVELHEARLRESIAKTEII